MPGKKQRKGEKVHFGLQLEEIQSIWWEGRSQGLLVTLHPCSGIRVNRKWSQAPEAQGPLPETSTS